MLPFNLGDSRLLIVGGAVFLAFLLFGCLGSIGSGDYANNYLTALNRTAISDPSMIEECKIGSCYCFVCKNSTDLFGMTSYVGGRCYFETNCTKTRAANLSSNKETPDLSIRQFMIGQGPTFSDFSAANPYCSHRLSMPVQWLVGTNESPYTLPDPARAVCFISKDMIPVYVLYSNGQDINDTRAKKIAEILATEGDNLFGGKLATGGPVGPVIIVTEMDFNETDAQKVANQVKAINDACNRRQQGEVYCMVAVAPKINDFKALDAVMDKVDKGAVDFVAFGVNGNYVHGCEGPQIMNQVLNFSMYSLYKYGKPTVIPYIMFDTQGTDIDNTCTWTESRMMSAYSSFFPRGIISLQDRGVIGIAPYSFNSTSYGVSNPLKCVDCAVGKNEQRLKSWYSWCQSFTNITTKLPTSAAASHPSGMLLTIFPNESGGTCDHNAQADFMLREMSFGDAASYKDIMNPRTPQLRTPTEKYFACDACIVTQNSSKMLFAFPKLTGSPGDICTKYPEIDQWAGARNLDPMLVRAIVYTESNFDPCVAVKVCSKEYKQAGGTGCFQKDQKTIDDDCYSKGYDAMYDPASLCPSPGADFASDSASPPGWRYCALGMMQTLEPPYTFWPASYAPDGKEGQYYEIYQKASMSGSLSAAKACDPEYNPFNASHSLCMGTAILEAKMEDARTWVENKANHRYLNWPTSDYERDNIFTAYVAMNKYGGLWDSKARTNHPTCHSSLTNGDCWARGFLNSWTVNKSYCTPEDASDPLPSECKSVGEPDTSKCYGYDDFVEYVNDCEVEYLRRPVDSGAKKMSVYYWLVNNCEQSFCPDGYKLMKAEEKDIPTSGTPYIPDTKTAVSAVLPSGSGITATPEKITLPTSGITANGS